MVNVFARAILELGWEVIHLELIDNEELDHENVIQFPITNLTVIEKKREQLAP